MLRVSVINVDLLNNHKLKSMNMLSYIHKTEFNCHTTKTTELITYPYLIKLMSFTKKKAPELISTGFTISSITVMIASCFDFGEREIQQPTPCQYCSMVWIYEHTQTTYGFILAMENKITPFCGLAYWNVYCYVWIKVDMIYKQNKDKYLHTAFVIKWNF